MKRITLLPVFVALTVWTACESSTSTAAQVQADPDGLVLTQLSESSVRLTWNDNAVSETGYWVFLRTDASGFYVEPLNLSDPLPAGTTEYTFDGLETGKSYSFGVQALGESMKEHSQTVYTPKYTMLTPLDFVEVENPSRLAAPAPVHAVQAGPDGLRVRWEAVSGAVSYYVCVRGEAEESFSSVYATVGPETTVCEVTGLPAGNHVAGVFAGAAHITDCSVMAESEVCKLPDASKVPVINSVNTTYAYALVNYTASVATGAAEYGLAVSADGIPTLEDATYWGPSLPSDKTVGQLIPNAVLDYGKTYQVSAYVKTSQYTYISKPVSVTLEAEPDLPQLQWTRVANPAGIPSGVEVYATSTPLNGRAFKAWYAVADCSKDVELRVLFPSAGLTTIDKLSAQYDGDCYVLVNGGYFAWDSGWYTPFVLDGARYGEGYGGSHHAEGWALTTPGVVGVDRAGKPAAYWWAARPNDVTYYYDLPMPTVPDQARYWYGDDAAKAPYFPGPDQKWEPYNAISAGPMVLYGSKVVVDGSHTGSYYTTNYELWASDIFPGYLPDRTAIGYTADGRVVLFVCDGRVDESDGASLPELGLVMKSIGCVGAMNLDGGGSTGMMFGSDHLNTWYQGKGTARKMEYRAVRTAVGFFKRR